MVLNNATSTSCFSNFLRQNSNQLYLLALRLILQLKVSEVHDKELYEELKARLMQLIKEMHIGDDMEVEDVEK